MNKFWIGLIIFLIILFILFEVNSISISNNSLIFQLNYSSLNFNLIAWLIIFIFIGVMLGIGYRVIK